MTPYYDHGGITIYHGDCREVVRDVRPDSVVTDPPYGTGWYATDTDVLSPTLLRALVDFGPTAVFGYATRLVRLCAASGLVPSEWLVWWPTNGAVRGFNLAGLRREAEHVAFFGKHRCADLRQARGSASRRILAADYRKPDGSAGRGMDTHGDPDERRMSNVWTDAAPGLGFQSHLRQHPNEKPIPVVRRLVEAVGGDLVLDPFMGSGTTLRAAKDLGRRAIGIEIEERYCEIAAQRLGQEVMDLGEAA